MPLFAICSGLDCDYQIQLQDNKDGTSVDTPRECPKCRAPMIVLCPRCQFPLVRNLDAKNPRCPVCRQDICKVFWDSRGRAASG